MSRALRWDPHSRGIGSIPLALAEAVGQGKAKDGNNIIAVASFGASLNWGCRRSQVERLALNSHHLRKKSLIVSVYTYMLLQWK